jgi:SAM-dependent methyltransferase
MTFDAKSPISNSRLPVSAGYAYLRTDGIWSTSVSAEISYPSGGNNACLAVEDKSFWFRHRNRCILEAVASVHSPQRGCILDVGAGNGFVARGLIEAGYEVVAVEPGQDGARNAKARGVSHVICATSDACGFTLGSIPAIGAFDVLEHMADDIQFLMHLRSLLNTNGVLILTVPAYSALWSIEDVEAGHFRRYSAASLRRALATAGFDVVFDTYFFRWLPLPIAVFRALPYRFGVQRSASSRSDVNVREHAAESPKTARIIEKILAGEIRNIRLRQRIGFGASLLAIARPA